jgi:hypothetical protein
MSRVHALEEKAAEGDHETTSVEVHSKPAEGVNETVRITQETTTDAVSSAAGPTSVLAGLDDDTSLMLGMLLSSATGGEKSKGFKYSSTSDKLDLAGLLNVLDGVVDCPSRILVMTTNHPEKLDAALIRPGTCHILFSGLCVHPPITRLRMHRSHRQEAVPRIHSMRPVFANGVTLLPVYSHRKSTILDGSRV